MKILIVGCGAVGQVYGLILQKAGVELGLFDRPAVARTLEEALGRGGLPLYQITFAHRRDPILRRLEKFRVMADEDACRQFAPDQIWFTVPSQAYHSEWFGDFMNKIPARRIVCFAPEGPRPEFFPEGGAEKMVFGGTAFMAWQGGPEAGGGTAGGVNFWLPGLGIPLAGTDEACREVGAILMKAGLRFAAGKPDSKAQGGLTAAMTAFTAGLELAGWSLAEYRASPWLARAGSAAGEAIRGQSPRAGAAARALLGGPVLAAAFRIVALCLPALLPFDVEKYLRFHYTKTRGQTLALLEMYAGDAEKVKMPAEKIRTLEKALRG